VRLLASPRPTAVAQATSAPTTAPARRRLPKPKVKTFRLVVARKGGKVYAKAEGNELIYEIDPLIRTHLLAELHDRRIFRFSSSQVVGLTLELEKERHDFAKREDKWVYLTDPIPIDEQKVTDLIDALRDMRTHRFVSYHATDLERFGLDDPAKQVVITLDDGTTYRLLVANDGPDRGEDRRSRYAVVRKGEQDAGPWKVFLLKPEQIRKFDKRLSDFEKKD